MNFCQEHWDLLREKIYAAGLESLIADTGAEVAERLADSINTEETTLSNYDPLMSAMFALTNHAYTQMGDHNARICLLGGDCPICIANKIHDASCTEEGCELKFERFYENAVADEVERSKKLLKGETGV